MVLLAPTSPPSSSWLLSPHPVFPSFPPLWKLAALLPEATHDPTLGGTGRPPQRATTSLLVPAPETQPSSFPLSSDWSVLGAMGQEERTRVLQPVCGGDPATQLRGPGGEDELLVQA